ncbi:hypothetical protein ALP50_03177 [Pseudomonas syringae pv. spinaceae]|nr:hypothetical protein ALP50_03177 [Pseudomonas syringae pv. spinaceae]
MLNRLQWEAREKYEAKGVPDPDAAILRALSPLKESTC